MSNKWFIALFVILPCVGWTFIYQYQIADIGQFKGVVQSDGKGYYAYLPAVWLEQDLTWNFFYEKDNEAMLRHFDDRFLTDYKGKKVLKTYCGEAILLSPFFIAGSLKAWMTGDPCTGYEPYMQAMIHIAALFYLILGIFYWMKFLALFHLRKNVIQFSVLAILFATNLFHYATAEVTMTHVYSFSLIACFLYAGKQLLETQKWRYYVGCALILALISLVRPINVLAVFILPFLVDGEKLKAFLISYPLRWFVAASVFLGVFSIQPILNFVQCGSLFPWSYGEEGFFWTNPEVTNVLFSFRKGLFIYTPIFFLIVLAVFMVWKFQKRLVIGTLVIACIVLYIISAWWSWYFGPGFGHRAFIDWFPILFIPLALAFHHLSIKTGRILKIGVAFCIALNLIQTYQYQSGIFEKEDMSAGGYNYVFLKFAPAFKNILAGEHELHYLPIDATIADTIMHFTGSNSIAKIGFENRPDVFVFDKQHLYSPVFSYVDINHDLRSATWFSSTLSIQTTGGDPCRNASIVLTIADSTGERLVYKSMRFRDFPDITKTAFDFTVEQLIEPMKTAGSKMDVYVYNPDSAMFALDDFSVKIQSFKREIH
jgi:hypothetical protein